MRMWIVLVLVVSVAIVIWVGGSGSCKHLENVVKSTEHQEELIKTAVDKTPPFDMTVSVPIKVPVNKEYRISLGKMTIAVNVLVVNAMHKVQSSAVFFYNKLTIATNAAVAVKDEFVVKPVAGNKLEVTAKDGKVLGSLDCTGVGCYLVISGTANVQVVAK